MSIFSDGVKTAFSVSEALGLLKSAVFVSDAETSVYDEDSREYISNAENDSAKVLKYDFESNKVNGDSVQKGDANIAVQVSDLENAIYEFITIGSEKWTIKNIETDPSDSLKIFHVRLAND